MVEVWSRFEHDPRDPAYADLRASDRDRDVVGEVLADGYAQGRLTREELDERQGTLASTRTLGELPALVTDLVPREVAARRPTDLATATPGELDRLARARYAALLRRAVAGFVLPVGICLAVWALTTPGGYFWPMWVMLGTAIGPVSVLLRHADVVAHERRRLERRQVREIDRAARRERDRPN